MSDKPKPQVRIAAERDLEYFDRVIKKAPLWARISQDNGPTRKQFTLSPLVEREENVFLRVYVDEKPAGFFVAVWRFSCLYEAHVALECRGAAALEAGRMARDYMFVATDCTRLTTFCPGNHPEVLRFARLCGLQFEHEREAGWVKEKKVYPLTFVSITLTEWVRGNHTNFRAFGQKFRDQISVYLPEIYPPTEDPWSESMIGLALYIAILGQQPVKALGLYNQWAAFAGATPVSFIKAEADRLICSIQGCEMTIDGVFNVEMKEAI